MACIGHAVADLRRCRGPGRKPPRRGRRRVQQLHADARLRPRRDRGAIARHRRRRVRAVASVFDAAQAVRPAYLQLSGNPIPARGHRDGDRGGEAPDVPRGVDGAEQAAIQQAGRDRQALLLRAGHAHDDQSDPDPRRLRVHQGVSGRANVPRCKDLRDRRGHVGNSEARHRAKPPQGAGGLTYSEVAKGLRLPLGFILGISYLIFSRPTPLTLAVGGVIALIGVIVRAWASGHISKNERLATTGPYAHTRNPLYFGSFLIAAGFAIAWHWSLLLLVVAFFVLIYAPTMQRERANIARRFPEEYEAYALNVPAFVPRPTPWNATHPDEDEGFSFALYMKNGEWKAGLTYVLVIAWLIWHRPIMDVASRLWR